MKKILLSIILITTIMVHTQAQTTDVQLIETTIGHYFEGLVDHKPESLKKAFHPSASMKWVEKGKYMEVNALDALTEHVTKNPVVKAKAKISSITVAGEGANAKLEIEYETFTFVDFMHLLKIEGEWKIVSKTYTTIPKDF